METIIKITRKFIDVLFVIIIIALIGYFGLRIAGIIDVYKVQTGSMVPTIKINDYIMTYKSKEYKKGDIVTFKFEDSLVTHRIMNKQGNKIITRGDANNINDDETDISNVVGKVIIIGGLLNIVVDYKIPIIALMLAIYLLTCYLNDDEKEQGDKNGKEKEKSKT
jgi:signal peptidase